MSRSREVILAKVQNEESSAWITVVAMGLRYGRGDSRLSPRDSQTVHGAVEQLAVLPRWHTLTQ